MPGLGEDSKVAVTTDESESSVTIYQPASKEDFNVVSKPSKTIGTSLDAEDITDDETYHNGSEIDCAAYRKFMLMYDIDENGTLVDTDVIRLVVQFREDGGTWHDYAQGPFAALYEEESTTPCNVCLVGDCVGENIRVRAWADYPGSNDPTNDYYTVTAKVKLMK